MAKIRIILSGILAIFVISSLQGQQDAYENSKSLLWRISGNNLSKPSYLFGTIHLICPDDYLWTGKMKESLASCDKVCFEMNLNDTSIKKKLLAAMIDHSGKKLEEYFTPAEYSIVERYFRDSLHMNMSRLQSMKPVVLQALIMKKVVGCNHPISYERHIMKTAIENGKEIMGLESLPDQIDLLEKMPPEKTVKGLIALVNGNRTAYEVFGKLMDAYKKQDLPLLYKMAEHANGVYNTDIFIDERNKKWISKMQDEMEHASVFFAVGAAHLWGGEGVINLLTKAGYDVAPLIDTVNTYDAGVDLQAASEGSDRMPKPGYDFGQYLQKTLHYPDSARKKNISGRVLVKFVVNEDGSISDCKVMSGIGGGCDEEAIRVIQDMPPWLPGLKNGVPVKVYFTQPLTFRLEEPEQNNNR